MSAELEAAAAESVPHLTKRARKHAPPPGAACPNCSTVLEGPYCHVCGQGADTHKRSIGHLIWEATEGLFHLDGRLARTLPLMFFRPGQLARDYMEGRLQRHVPPFRTFLVALLIFIFAAEHAAHEMILRDEQKKAAEAAALATPQGRANAAAARRTEAAKDLQEAMTDAAAERADELKDKDSKPERVQARYDRDVAKARTRYAMALHRADRVAQGLPAKAVDEQPPNARKSASNDRLKAALRKAVDNPDYYWSVLFTWGHRAAILLLPIVGLSLALAYRRRRDLYVYDHLLVAMNLLAFGFLISAVGLVLPFAAMRWWFALVGLWTLVNLFQTLRGAYGSGWFGATAKTLLVWTVTMTSALMLLTGLMAFVLTVL